MIRARGTGLAWEVMRTLPSLFALSLAAAPLLGCGDDGGGEIPPDSSVPDVLDPPETIEVTLHARGTKVLAIREGDDGAWRALTPGANGDVTAEIAKGRYAIAYVCDEPEFFNDSLVLAGPDDPREHDVWCNEPAGERVDVTIASDDDLRVRIGIVSSALPGASMNVKAGTYDVIAVERNVANPRFVIRHGVELNEDTTLTFDLDTEGTAMRRVPVTADLADGEAARVSSRLSTARGTGFTVFSDDEVSALVFPSAALAADDVQRVSVTAQGEDAPGTRSTSRTIADDPESVAITLPPGLTSASATWNGAMTVSWQATGAWTNAFAFASDEELTKIWDVVALPGWFAAGGAAGALPMPAPTELPGWDAAWNTATPVGLSWDLSVTRTTANGNELIGWAEPFAVAKRSAGHAHGDAEEMRAARVLRHDRLGVR